MHHVQDHRQAQPVGGVDEVLELVRVAIATGGSVKGSDVVTKAPIVGMFHNGH